MANLKKVLKGAGIAVVSELGAQLCADAGESALAGGGDCH